MKKTCIDCDQNLSVEAFYRVHKDSEHRQSRCKRCDNKRRAGKVYSARNYSERRKVSYVLPNGQKARAVDVVRDPATGELRMVRR